MHARESEIDSRVNITNKKVCIKKHYGKWFVFLRMVKGSDKQFLATERGSACPTRHPAPKASPAMPLNDTELRNYDSNVLRLPADKRTAYHGQVDRLIAELSKTVRSKTKIDITRVVKAGSFAKFTILRLTTADPVD